jgi:hypothetical protein
MQTHHISIDSVKSILYGNYIYKINVFDIIKKKYVSKLLKQGVFKPNNVFTDPIPHRGKKLFIILKDGNNIEINELNNSFNVNLVFENKKEQLQIQETVELSKKTQTVKIDKTDILPIGFIIIRHVNSKKTNLYWIECYNCIRKFYPYNKIVIIDDNSNYIFITNIELDNCEIIRSEFHKRGELLPYYYYSKNKWFDKAIIIHDSVFIKQHINFDSVKIYKILWQFRHKCDQISDEKRIISKLKNNTELLKFHDNKNKWVGCFGCMSVITHDYLKYIDNIHDFSQMLSVITTRYNRCSFERVIGCMLQFYNTQQNVSVFGDIHRYCKWGIKFEERNKYNLPFVKVWTGR